MDWQVTLFERDRLITFRGLTRHESPGAILGDVERWIEPGQEWGGWNYGQWLAFLKERGGSVTVGFDGSGGVVVRDV